MALVPVVTKYGRQDLKLTIIVVIANNYFLNQAVLAHLAPKVLVESVEMVLKLAWVHLVLGIEGRILVQVWEENRLRV